MGIEIEPPKKLRSGKAEEWYPGKFLKEWKPLIPRKKLLGELMASPPILVGGEWVNSEIDKMIEAKKTEWRCLTKDTLVLSNPGGLVSVSDLNEGSKVLTFNEGEGSISSGIVKAVRFNGIQDVFEVKAKGLSIRCTANHPFLCLERSRPYGQFKGKSRLAWVLRWKTVSELNVNDPVAVLREIPEKYCRAYPLERIFSECMSKHAHRFTIPSLPRETDEDLTWLMGLYLGDGNSRIRSYPRGQVGEVVFHIPENDPVRQPLVELLRRYRLNPRLHKNCVSVHSLFLARFIAKLGLTGDAHTKRIPPWVFRLPKLQRLALIAGVIDADGYVNEKGRFEISLCNKPLIQDLIHVATLSGLNTSKIYERISYGFATRPAKVPFVEYKIVIPCKPEIPVRNSKHKQRLRKGFVRLGVEESKWAQRRYPFLGFVRVHSIQKVGKEPVYDVAIEGSHNFVANCFLVHNSKGYSENLIRMAEDLAKSWVAKLSETFAPPDVREAVVRHMMPKGLEVADRWLATIGAAVMASKSPV